MKYFAPVAPIKLLTELHHKHNVAGSYHLLLAHDVVKPENEKAYHDLFHPRYTSGGRDWHVIMDNSVIELGHPVSPVTLLKAAKLTRAKVIVLPDALLDGPRTIELTRKALKEWSNILNDLETTQLMVVPQGKTLEEWLDCALCLMDIIKDVPRIQQWGIPRNFRDVIGISRATAVRTLKRLSPHPMRIHMLGFSEDTKDDIMVTRDYDVVGIDSAVPVRMGQMDNSWKPGVKVPPRGDWFDDRQPTATELCVYNINLTRELINE